MSGQKLFGNRIKTLRTERNLTQDNLAEIVNVQPRHISRIENGHSFCSFEVLESFARAFDLQIKDLFDFEQDFLKDIDIENEIANIVHTQPIKNKRLFYRIINFLK